MYSPRSANLSRTINCGTQCGVDKKHNKFFLTFKHLFDIMPVIRLAKKKKRGSVNYLSLYLLIQPITGLLGAGSKVRRQ